MSADRQSLDEQMRDSARDREELRQLLKAAERANRYRVVRQFSDKGELVEVTVCGHRFEWRAEVCAYRHTMRHRTAPGGHYTVRRVGA